MLAPQQTRSNSVMMPQLSPFQPLALMQLFSKSSYNYFCMYKVSRQCDSLLKRSRHDVSPGDSRALLFFCVFWFILSWEGGEVTFHCRRWTHACVSQLAPRDVSLWQFPFDFLSRHIVSLTSCFLKRCICCSFSQLIYLFMEKSRPIIKFGNIPQVISFYVWVRIIWLRHILLSCRRSISVAAIWQRRKLFQSSLSFSRPSFSCDCPERSGQHRGTVSWELSWKTYHIKYRLQIKNRYSL